MIESVNCSIMQLIMLLHTRINTAFLFWANLGFLKMSILEYCVMLLVSFYMSAFFKFLNFKDITLEICNIFGFVSEQIYRMYMAWKTICIDFELF